jgi:integrase
MLRLFKREGSPYWYIRRTLPGRAVYASTKERDKADARRFKAELEIRIARAAGQKCHAATFEEAADLYIKARQPRKAWLVNIKRLSAVIGDRLLADIRQHMLVDAANALYPRCLASTKNWYVFAPAAAILHYAAENDLCPYVRVKKLAERKAAPRDMRKEDAARLIAAAGGKLRLLLVFLFAQGWRVSDALRLRWQDVNLSEATVLYHVSKTNEWLMMPLHLAVLNMLRDEPAQVGRVFPWGGRTSLYRELQPLCRQAGVHFTPHMARHSFATWLGAEGASVFEIMKAGDGRIIARSPAIQTSMCGAFARRSIELRI